MIKGGEFKESKERGGANIVHYGTVDSQNGTGVEEIAPVRQSKSFFSLKTHTLIIFYIVQYWIFLLCRVKIHHVKEL